MGEDGADPPPDRRTILLIRFMRASTATANGYPSCVGAASDLSTASILGAEEVSTPPLPLSPNPTRNSHEGLCGDRRREVVYGHCNIADSVISRAFLLRAWSRPLLALCWRAGEAALDEPS